MNTNPITALLGPVTDREYLEYIRVIKPLPLGAMPVFEFDGKEGDMTPSEVKAKFEAQGIPVSQWADQHGYPRSEVYRILNGFAACKRGRAHEIATKLGIKPSSSNKRIPA